MKVKELLQYQLETIKPETSVYETAKKMRDLNVGAFPVIENGKAVGIVTDRDITLRVTAEKKSPENIKVKDIMSTGIQTIKEDEDVDSCAKLMESKKVRRCVVTDKNNKAIGIVSLHDLALNAKTQELAGKIMRKVSSSQPKVHALPA